MTIEQKKELLQRTAESNADVFEGVKNKRLRLVVNYQTRAAIAKESFELGLYNVDYIVLTALAFDSGAETMAYRLKDISRGLDKYMNKQKIKYKSIYNKDDRFFSDEAIERRNSYMAKKGRPATNEPKESVHLRLTPAAHNILREKASDMGLSVSDYVEFVVANFDIMSISASIDEISGKVNTILEQQG